MKLRLYILGCGVVQKMRDTRGCGETHFFCKGLNLVSSYGHTIHIRGSMRASYLNSKLSVVHLSSQSYYLLFKMVLPTINKALRFSSLGGDLELLETEVLPLPTNEILVKVHAASINPCDIQLWRSGLIAVVAGDKGMGKDFSGTVVSVGSGVRGWAEGDDIFGLLFHVVCSRFMPQEFYDC